MSEPKAQNSETAILKAAEAEFFEKGYAGARTVSIAEKAGVTHSMLHYYFRTKEQLFNKIIEDKFNLLANSVLAIFTDTNLPLKERLSKGISVHFDFLMENPLLPKFLVREIDHVDHILVAKIFPKMVTAMQLTQPEIDFDIRHLLLDIMAQNIFPFLVYPLTEKMGFLSEGREVFMEQIKQENITIIMKRLGL
jgi:AcrR family transcriptional regulator